LKTDDITEKTYISILSEVIRLVPYLSAKSFAGGDWFLGNYLCHAEKDISFEASNSVQHMFAIYPEVRIGMIRGFLSFFKAPVMMDENLVLSYLLHLLVLVNKWIDDGVESSEKASQVLKVSCKLDALMIILLGRPTVRIRKTCMQILKKMQNAVDIIYSTSQQSGKLTLYQILTIHDDDISKAAIFAFADKNLALDALSPSIIGGMSITGFRDVCASDFAHLYTYYYGALINQFLLHGREKSLRHAGKYLRHIAIPFIGNPLIRNPEGFYSYHSHIILLLSLAGVPDKSEITHTVAPLKTSANTLYEGFKHLLPKVSI
jgi:hypothetical protein